jgi:acyl carrier protein
MTDTDAPTRTVLREKIIEIVAREGAIDASSIRPDASLADLQIASADMIMILMAIEEEFDVYVPVDGALAEAVTVGALIDGITAHITLQRD